jgi:hypothetical protein
VYSGRSDDETDVVSTTTTGAPGHLLQAPKLITDANRWRACVSAGQHNSASGKVDAGGDCRGGEDRVEQSRAHQFFDHEFPRGNVSGVMRRNAAANDRVPMSMTTHFRMLFDKRAHEIAARFTTAVVRIASRECGFRRGLIAATTRRHEHDRGKQVVTIKRRQQCRRRHLRHPQFHLLSDLRSSAANFSISGFRFPDSFNNGNNRLSGSNTAERNGTGRFPGPVITPQRTPRTSSSHNANSCALPIVADNSNKPNPRRRQNDRLFPNVPAVFVGEIVCFVKHDQIRTDFTAATQRVEKLIAIDLSRADDQRSVGVFFSVARQNPDFSAPNSSMNSWYLEFVSAFSGDVYQARRPLSEKPANLLARNPRLAAAGRRGYEHVFVLQCASASS